MQTYMLIAILCFPTGDGVNSSEWRQHTDVRYSRKFRNMLLLHVGSVA